MSYAGYCPSGTVFAFAGSSAPNGWINCDGSEYSQTLYSELFSAIGTTYATQVNPTTGSAWASPTSGFFRVPDYRSLFLRGTGTNNLAVANTLGVWKDDATAKNSLANLPSSISGSGTTGGMSANATHSHNWYGNAQGGRSGINWSTGRNELIGTADNFITAASTEHTHTVSVSGTATAQVITGDTETRPQSQVVNYIIKI